MRTASLVLVRERAPVLAVSARVYVWWGYGGGGELRFPSVRHPFRSPPRFCCCVRLPADLVFTCDLGAFRSVEPSVNGAHRLGYRSRYIFDRQTAVFPQTTIFSNSFLFCLLTTHSCVPVPLELYRYNSNYIIHAIFFFVQRFFSYLIYNG